MRSERRLNQPLVMDQVADRFRRKYWGLQRESNASRADAPARTHSTAGMTRFRSVLVLLDGTPRAEHAIPIALEIAERTGAELELAHVQLLPGFAYDAHGHSFEEASGFQRKLRMRKYLADVVERLADYREASIARLPRNRSSATEIIESIATSDTLVVLAHRCRGALGWFQFGSVAERLLNVGSSPLLFVPSHRGPVHLGDQEPLGHLLTVLDGGAETERILPSAASIAAKSGAKHTLLRIVPSLPYHGIRWKEKVREASAQLDRAAENVRDRGLSITTEILTSDEATGEVILAHAQRTRADVIAMAISRQSRMPGFFRREPAEYLIRKGRIPVLVTRPDGDRRQAAARPSPKLRAYVR